MKKIFFFIAICIGVGSANAQSLNNTKDSSWKNSYRESYTKINDLVHTKLDVKFDYLKSWMYGKAWITLKPHYYATDTLTLDAKGMEIKEVAIMKGTTKAQLKYNYTGMQLFIQLDKQYKGGENYTIYIDYTSKPDELKLPGSAAITSAKGLYFINPKGEEKDKATQIWTQGETESNSVWMPTIDKPNQKSTEEIYMTVPAKYVTLSNGLLISQKKNTDGTRTDYWKMDLPHAPYLFFMGVGDFAIIKDAYKGKEVSYYVEKREAPYARGVFGKTPEMIKFFSTKLGVEYPWAKYSQMVGRDYVSGAMENTTATLHQESAYQNARQLTDGNAWEETIAHELFHQWFGDLVTAESWSNLTVNESFANYSEYLWLEYKYGKDAANAHNLDDMNGYLGSNSQLKNLVRFNYADKEDVFDAVSYNKGGRILNMLRNYVGDDAFFKSLNNYLITNKFKSGEADQLRLAFEEVTGKDMNWFWNQWYFGSGHPKVAITYNYDASAKKMFVYLRQTQLEDKVFKMPFAIDIYSGAGKVRTNVWMQNRSDTFVFDASSKPNLVNVDAEKGLLWEKTDNKTAEEFVFQYKNATNYLDRKEALEYFTTNEMKELALGINDKFAGLRRLSIDRLAKSKIGTDVSIISSIEKMVATELDKKTKAAAIKFLATSHNEKYKSLFNKLVNDSSYSVAGAALEGLSGLDPANSYNLAKKYMADSKGALGTAIIDIIIANGTELDFDYIAEKYNVSPLGMEKLEMTGTFSDYLAKIKDVEKIKKGVDYISKFRNLIPEEYKSMTEPAFKAAFNKLSNGKISEVSNYIKSTIK